MLLNGEAVALPLDRFDLTNGILIAEASDLQWAGLMQLYDDACDVGIFIRSHKTGKVEAFHFSTCERTPDGEDIAGWLFKPCNRNLTKVKEVLILND